MFHTTFYSCDVISNDKTSNFEWFNKTKTRCKIITIKKSYTCTHQIKVTLNKEDSDDLSKLQEQNGEEYEDAAEEVEDRGKREG